MQKRHVIAAKIFHFAPHAGKTFAEAQIVSRVVLGRFTLAPVPIAAILQINDANVVAVNDVAVGLQSQIVHAAQTLFKNLRAHDR